MNRIKELREEKNWKQEDLGKLLGVQKATASKYETEKIPLTADTIRKLSTIFDVSTDYILGISSIRKNKANIENSAKDEYGLSAENTKELKKYAELLKLKQLNDENSEFGNEFISLMRHK